jgi:hypothetical protein
MLTIGSLGWGGQGDENGRLFFSVRGREDGLEHIQICFIENASKIRIMVGGVQRVYCTI